MQVKLLLSVRLPRSTEISSHLSTLAAPDHRPDRHTYMYIIAHKSYPRARRARSVILRCHSPIPAATIGPLGSLPPNLCTTCRNQNFSPSHAIPCFQHRTSTKLDTCAFSAGKRRLITESQYSPNPPGRSPPRRATNCNTHAHTHTP